jgi:hypothetical protein
VLVVSCGREVVLPFPSLVRAAPEPSEWDVCGVKPRLARARFAASAAELPVERSLLLALVPPEGRVRCEGRALPLALTFEPVLPEWVEVMPGSCTERPGSVLPEPERLPPGNPPRLLIEPGLLFVVGRMLLTRSVVNICPEGVMGALAFAIFGCTGAR